MSDAASWQEANARYLSAAMTWLRERLDRRAIQEGGPTPAIGPAPKPERRTFWRRLLGRRLAEPPSPLATPVPVTQTPTAEEAPTMPARGSPSEPPPALLILGQRLGLS